MSEMKMVGDDRKKGRWSVGGALGLLMALSAVLVMPAQAVPYPVATDVVVSYDPGDRNYYYYDITWSVVDLGSEWDSFVNRPNSALMIGPGFTGRALQEIYTSESDGCNTAEGNSLCYVKIRPGETVAKAAVRNINTYGNRSRYRVLKSIPLKGISFSYFHSFSVVGGSIVTPLYQVSSLTPENQCTMTTPALTLDHGSLDIEQVASSKVIGTLTLNCASPATVIINLPSVIIGLGGGASAKLYINDRDIGSGNRQIHTVPAGESRFTLTDSLHNITTGGTYSGTDVVIVEMQ